MWAEGKTVLFRTAIFVGMASVVTTIIYFTPIPGQEFMSCDRVCHELEMPMICRLKLTFESYHTLSRSCSECPKNSSACYHRHCISGDGTRMKIRTANRQMPGTSLHVCENDILVIDVINRIAGEEVTVHWRGQPVQETPFMDGVPMVTQCPITSATTFQYKFRASVPGTHVWHAHSDQDIDGQFGALIVRQTESRSDQRYDVDRTDHLISVNTWRDDAGVGTLLINGKTLAKRDGFLFPASTFLVTSGLKHRFRLINSGGRGNTCPIRISLDGHSLQVISLDGHGVLSKDVDAIILAAGERVDFVLHANQPNSTYLLHAVTFKPCPNIMAAVGLLQYDSPLLVDVDTSPPDRPQTLTTSVCDQDLEVCLAQLEGVSELEERLSHLEVDLQVVLEFGYKMLASDDNVTAYFADYKVPYVNNISFMYPPSPLLTQRDLVNTDVICDKDKRPSRCSEGLCECVHVIEVPLHSAVELILNDHGGHSHQEHVFHLHGYNFHVVSLSSKKVVSRNVHRPVIKDTIRVPRKGVAVLRFIADNPGYWLLSNNRAAQLNVVFHVGESGDTPYTPDHFPQCGSWIGPDFFLI